MRRVRRYGNRWRDLWLFKRFFPPKINERFCPKCTLPYQDGPMPKELFSDSESDVGYLVYPGGSYRKGSRVAVFVRWNKKGTQYEPSQYIPIEELPDLLTLVTKAVEKYSPEPKTKAKRK